MKKYRIKFHGRAVNAHGVFEYFTVEIEAANEDAAIHALYNTHEHIRIISINGESWG